MPSRHKKMRNPETDKKKKITLTDLILFLAAIFIMLRTPWGHMDSFDHLILFLYALCVLLRISNLRKMRIREMERERKKAEQAQTAPEQNTSVLPENAASVQEADNNDAGTEENTTV